MLKKRLIFTLLYSDGYFMLSRNFRLQKVGDIHWLQKNYNFSEIAFSIDELIVLDVSKGRRDSDLFCKHLEMIAKECFVPIAAGGGIRSIEDARKLINCGADKVVVNSLFVEDPTVIDTIASVFGQQCIIASIDVKKENSEYIVYTHNGLRKQTNLSKWLDRICEQKVGELYLNSIDHDGTGQGYCINMLHLLTSNINLPLILAGGAGNYRHLMEGLSNEYTSAVSTAHLFNFIGNGLQLARLSLIKHGMQLVVWDQEAIVCLRGVLNSNFMEI